MKIVVIVVIVLFVLYTAFFAFRTNRFLKNIRINKEKMKKIKQKNDSQLVIAIPCLREQNCIEDTVKYFKTISLDIPIILVTTQKEIKENKNNLMTTQDVIREKIVSKYDNVYWIDYPYEIGYMADQLNYMLDNLNGVLNKKVNLKNTYLENNDIGIRICNIDDYFDNLKEAYDWFNCFVTGFCNLRDGNEYRG